MNCPCDRGSIFAWSGSCGRLLRREGYRIVHAHTPRSALPGRLAALWTGIPFVYHVHSPACRDTTSRGQNLINRLAERLSLAGNCMLIAVSSSLGHEMLRQGVRPVESPSWPTASPRRRSDAVPTRRDRCGRWA